MAVANKVSPKTPITQTGALGYLLWLRRDLPPVYSAVKAQFPAVANFETALLRQNAGLGQDDLTDSFSDTLPEIDLSATMDTPITSDFAPTFDTPTFTASNMSLPAPDLPPVASSIDAGGAAGAAASNVSTSTLSSIGSAVAAILPVAIKAASAVGVAVINSQTASKAQQTAQLQLAAAMAGKSPYQTGIITTGTGSQYLAPIIGANAAAALTSSVIGLPLWVWLAGGAGLFAIVLASKGTKAHEIP